uniref:WAP domain-containing protein n=1 Tax=Anas zonorhyncha TaxID=75864 RepID=A0A8B9VCZ3_9AVES
MEGTQRPPRSRAGLRGLQPAGAAPTPPVLPQGSHRSRGRAPRTSGTASAWSPPCAPTTRCAPAGTSAAPMGAGCAAPLLQKTRVTSPPRRDPVVAASCTSSTTSPPGAAGRSPTAAAGATPTTSGRGQSATGHAWDTRNPNPGSARRGCRGCQGHARRSAEVTATAPAHRSAATAAVGSSACPQPRPGRPASARPAQGCSPATTAGSGASETPTAPARRSAACVAVTPCACTRPEVGAARHPAGPPSRPPGPPSRTAPCLAEKPGICPLTEVAPWTRAPCQASCAEDGQCPGDEKCCSSRRCGRVCLAPERDKPGQCPKVRPRQAPELCTEEDACGHDRDCPRQEKCCFDGCAMRCTRPAREHPGECPQAEPCGDPRRRHGSQCLDDSACRRDEKCCSSGCAWVCVAVAVPGESQDGAPGQCVQECDTDLQCPQGQRCTSTSCGRVCGDVPGDAA